MLGCSLPFLKGGKERKSAISKYVRLVCTIERHSNFDVNTPWVLCDLLKDEVSVQAYSTATIEVKDSHIARVETPSFMVLILKGVVIDIQGCKEHRLKLALRPGRSKRTTHESKSAFRIRLEKKEAPYWTKSTDHITILSFRQEVITWQRDKISRRKHSAKTLLCPMKEQCLEQTRRRGGRAL
jgi:hypothetical protein